ncbi:MAG: ATP synthase subunit I [Deltaproteobacteria bacterium]|nr:ATP synthase subunit I [Deltaproteobacteria bacterium]
MASPSIQRIERLNYVIAIIVVAAGLVLVQSRSVVLGLMVGAGLTCLNFFVLRKLVVKWTEDAATGKGGNAQLLMLPKMIFLMGAVAVAVLFLPIDVISFVVGYSIFIISIVIETAYSALAGTTPPAQSSSEHDHG